jgi:predicted PhzF superfamily epimerase YddE/YHI9
MKYTFHIVDVFSSAPFGGNQLAVLSDAAGISTEGMQRIAREFNFGETTFVLPKNDPASTCQVRIFTPRAELDFAGHLTPRSAGDRGRLHKLYRSWQSGHGAAAAHSTGGASLALIPAARAFAARWLLQRNENPALLQPIEKLMGSLPLTRSTATPQRT